MTSGYAAAMRAVAVLLLITACGHDHHRDSTEVSLNLGKLTRNARSAFIADEKFPIGTVGPTPAAPCCGQPDNQCPVTDAWKKSSVWRDLEFEIDEPTYHQYSYESDGKTSGAPATEFPRRQRPLRRREPIELRRDLLNSGCNRVAGR